MSPSTPPAYATQSDLLALQARVEKLDHRLFGNGQPGELDKLEVKIDHLSDRVGKVLVFVAFLSGTAGIGATTVMQALFGAG